MLTSAVVVTVSYQPLMVLVLLVVAVGVVVVLVGVLLPGVWSRRRWRREAAASTQDRVLAAIGRWTG